MILTGKGELTPVKDMALTLVKRHGTNTSERASIGREVLATLVKPKDMVLTLAKKCQHW